MRKIFILTFWGFTLFMNGQTWTPGSGLVYTTGRVGIGTNTPLGELHLATDTHTGFYMTRANGTYGFRMLRNSVEGNLYIEARNASMQWETKISFEEGLNNAPILLNQGGGNVLIGKKSQVNSTYKLDVAGKIRADEIVVNMTGADFVFEAGYDLKDLAEVETFIKEHKHLPNIPSASEMEANGVDLAEMNKLLLQKVEELTLYIIDLEAKNENEKSERASIETRLSQIEALLRQFKK